MVHQPADGGDDVVQGEVGFYLHLRPHPVAALLPGHGPVVPSQLLPLGGREEGLVLHRVAQGADGPAGGLVGAGDHQRHRGPLAPGQVLHGSKAVAQVGRGQGSSLAQDAHRAASRERNQQVVGSLAVVVHPDGVSLRVGVGDEGGDVVEHGHGVQALGEQTEPLAGHRLVGQEGLGPSLKGCGGADTLFRGEVAVLRLRSEGAQAVGHGIHQPQFRQSFQPAAQSGGGHPVEAGQFAHGGQGRGAQLQQRVLLPLAQGGACRASVPCGTVGVGGYALRGFDGPRCRVDGLDAVAHGVQDGPGQGAAHVAPVQEPPEGVARTPKRSIVFWRPRHRA